MPPRFFSLGVSTLSILVSVMLITVVGVEAAQVQSNNCSVFQPVNTVPENFGSFYDVFQANRELILNSTDCTSTTFNVRIGRAGTTSTNFAVYEKGYIWDGTQWQGVTYTPDGGSRNGSYIMGNAKLLSPSQYYDMNTPFVAFTCSLVNGAWKCGCHDNVCAQNYWQIQAARKNAGTSGGGNTGGGGSGAGGVEIGLSNVTGDALEVFGTNIRWTAWFHGHFIEAISGRDNTPEVKRRIYAVGVVPQGSSWAAAANGSLEGYWRNLFQQYSSGMTQMGWQELLLGVWHEGNNQPGECWGVGQRGCPEWTTTEDFKEGVKRFVELGRSIDPRLKYYWNPGCWGNADFMEYVPYPGTIDYVGCDLYDNQNWNSNYPLSESYARDRFQTFVKPQLDPLVAYAKQNNIGLVFPEFGLAKRTFSQCGYGKAQGASGGDNVVFVDSFFKYLRESGLRSIVVYHNSDWDISSQIGSGTDCWGDNIAGRFPNAAAKLFEIFHTPGGARWGE